MIPADPAADARLALDVLATEDAYDASGGAESAILDMPLEPRLAPRWRLYGHIVGTDALLRRRAKITGGDRQVWYGYVLQSIADPERFAALIRGTVGFLEWCEDGEFESVPHPRAGRCEDGFWGVYRSLQFRRPGGPNVSLVTALSAIVGSGRLLLAGHSLGAALATFLATDLAEASRLGARVALRAFASPRPGDGLFSQYASALISDRRVYAREFDIVPRVPFGFGYASLPTDEIPLDAADVRVCFELPCQHHVLFYAMQLNSGCVDPSTLPPIDAKYVACLTYPTSCDAAARWNPSRTTAN